MFFEVNNTDFNFRLGMTDEEFYKCTQNNNNDSIEQRKLNEKLRNIFENLKSEHEKELFKCFAFCDLLKTDRLNLNISVSFSNETNNLVNNKYTSKILSFIEEINKTKEEKE